MRHVHSKVATVLAALAFAAAARGEGPAPQSKVATPVVRPIPKGSAGARLKALADQETRSLKGQEAAKLAARSDPGRTQFQARRASAVSRAAADAAACRAAPRIYEVTPAAVLPDDPVGITGCGFGAAWGMVLLSDGDRQLAVTSWSENAIEATIPHVTGFADPKPVTLRVVTVGAARSEPSPPLTLRPLLDLVELAPTGWALEGCHRDYDAGVVYHAFGALRSATCIDHYGTDRLRFSYALRGGWTFHSVAFTKLCGPTFSEPCGGENDATPAVDAYRVGRPELPDLLVSWKKDVAYRPAIRVMGPAGTPPR